MPGAWPLLGHAVVLLRDPLGFLRSLPEHGDLVAVRLGRVRAVFVCSPELVQQVLRDDRTFDKGGPLFDRLRETTGDGLGSCPHAAHRRQRRLVQPAFNRSRLPGYGRVLTGQVEGVTASWDDGGTVDVVAEMRELSTAILLGTVFSAESLPSPLALPGAGADLRTVVAGIGARTVLPPALAGVALPGSRRYFLARDRLRRFAGDIVAARRGGDGGDDGDLLSALLAAGDPDSGRGLSDTELVDQVVTMFVGGIDTTAATMAWMLHSVAGRPDIARRLQAEADTVLAGRAPSVQDLPALSLARQVVTETLRLHPVVWIVTRTVTADTVLGGHPVSAGTVVAFSPYLIHQRADCYPDADVFDPDRWGPGRTPPDRHAFLAFGDRARSCVGNGLAQAEAVMTLAAVASRWNLHPVGGGPVRPTRAAVMSPRGLRLRVTARTDTDSRR
ncbi:cytochrome P450 [Streptomyces anulatus]|uniref:cytochrome P450 n=1 Tax=Streptomyces sp. NBC_01498 TaxID=2975870 RepID=UPI002E7ADC05|nr:cytochrome P450 [Streptomyces sp. NBC_01498]WTL25689.1 cytochrome P450 [Streptomyces sp. NBC_01498]